MSADDIIDLYERHAGAYDRDRARTLQERRWLDEFLRLAPPGGTILDLGCGMGEPMARYVLEQGLPLCGVDSSPTLVGMCRARFPGSEWLVGDMRTLELGRRFAGVLAWDSFFHLTMDHQRGMFRRFADHALPGAPLLFTTGPREGEAMGSYCGEVLYHASLEPSEYQGLLTAHGFRVRAHVADDPDCGGHTVWLATFDGGTAGRSEAHGAGGRFTTT